MALRAAASQNGGAGAITSVTGTANQVTVTPNTGAVVVSLPNDVTISGMMTASGFNSNSSTLPANGMYLGGVNTLGFTTNTTFRVAINSTGEFRGANAASWLLAFAGASATVPTLVVNRTATGTGFGAQAAGNISAILGSAEAVRYVTTAITRQMTALTVGTLPAAGNAGSRAFVSDALAPVFAAAVTAGGAIFTPVYDDGVIWRCG